jgi:hypothetical protein
LSPSGGRTDLAGNDFISPVMTPNGERSVDLTRDMASQQKRVRVWLESERLRSQGKNSVRVVRVKSIDNNDNNNNNNNNTNQ